jgi:hypothetical protein
MQIERGEDGVLEILKHDHAMTVAVVQKRFGLMLEDLEILEHNGVIHLVNHELAVTHGSRQSHDITFVCRDVKTANRPGTSLRHLAGIAEMRYRLGSPRWEISMLQNPNSWSPFTGSVIPDALWYEPGNERPTAIEFDTGSHKLETVREKVEVYKRFGTKQIWAAPSARRAMSIVAVLEHSGCDPLMWQVFAIDWFGL